ncbi:hypothetical protein ACLIJR_05525 [Hydrogenophaga sp. XSHU_21]|jgi:hypothetical protein
MTSPDATLSAPQARPSGAPGQPAGEGLLERFVWRMGSHGMSVSRRLMLTDPAYAVQQMDHARQLQDPELTDMALALFGQFQHARSGLSTLH